MLTYHKLKAAGYLASLLPMLLLVLGASTGWTWLSVVFFFVVLPLLRPLVGNDNTGGVREPSLSAGLRTYLVALPRVYVACWVGILGWSAGVLMTADYSLAQWIGFAISFWVVNSLNTAVAHELIHAPTLLDRRLGRLLAATAGYFHLPEEHMSHHATVGGEELTDAPPASMSVYVYALARYTRSLRTAWEFEQLHIIRKRRLSVTNRCIWSAAIMLAVFLLYGLVAGGWGVLFYFGQVVGASFTVQAITFIQHWALRDSIAAGLNKYGYAWEDGCVMQACVTFNHAFHSHHHMRPRARYFELGSMSGSPILPASYPVMFMIALYPPAFQRIMKKRLDAWIAAQCAGSGVTQEALCVTPRDILRLVR